MKRLLSWFVTIMCLGTLGCNQTTPTEKATVTVGSDQHGHDHDDGSQHDHGDSTTDHSVRGHAHGAGPHGGTIADWGGGKYHVEFTVDHDQQQATAYVLGPDEKTPTPIASENIELSIQSPAFQLLLMPQPQDTDPAGQASRFVGTHESLGVVQEFSGTMTALVDGTPYSGDFAE